MYVSEHLFPLKTLEAGQTPGAQTFRGGRHGRHLQVIQIAGAVWHNVLHMPLGETAADDTRRQCWGRAQRKAQVRTASFPSLQCIGHSIPEPTLNRLLPAPIMP